MPRNLQAINYVSQRRSTSSRSAALLALWFACTSLPLGLCAIGLYGLATTPVLSISQQSLPRDAVTQLQAIGSLALKSIDLQPHPLFLSPPQQHEWWLRQSTLYWLIVEHSTATLTFKRESPYKVQIGAEIKRTPISRLAIDLSVEYLVVAIYVIAASAALLKSPRASGILAGLGLSGCATVLAAMAAFQHRSIAFPTDISDILTAGLCAGVVGSVSLLHFAMSFRWPSGLSTPCLALISGLYVFSLTKLLLAVVSDIPFLSLAVLLLVVAALFLAVAATHLRYARISEERRAVRGGVITISLTAAGMMSVWAVNPTDPLIHNALVGVSLLLPWATLSTLYRQHHVRELLGLQHGVARERELIRQELHDGVLNDLAAILATTENLSAARRNVSAHHVYPKLAAISTLAREASARVRNFMRLGRENEIGWLAFACDLETYTTRLLTSCGVRLHFFASPALNALTPPSLGQRLSIEHVVREALTNVIKHAQAKSVRIAVAVDKNAVSVDISDDGKGADPGACGAGHGLTNMRNRIHTLGGQLTVNPLPNRGTHVRISVPVGDHL